MFTKFITLLIIFRGFALSAQDEVKVLFVQPNDVPENVQKWMHEQETAFGLSMQEHQVNIRWQNKRLLDIVAYKYWVRKQYSESAGEMAIKYFLEIRDNSRFSILKTIPLAEFRGYDEADFKKWFETVMKKYMTRLKDKFEPSYKIIHVGKMCSDPTSINDIPYKLSTNMLRYKFKKSEDGIFTDHYCIQFDDNIDAAGEICINKESISETNPIKVKLKVLIHKKTEENNVEIICNNNFNNTVEKISGKIAEIIISKIK